MKIFDFSQESDQWSIWRTKGIGGSDAPSIMGVSPYRSYDDLLKQKVRLWNCSDPPFKGEKTAGQARGLRLEPEARSLYTFVTGIETRPVCVEDEERPWLRASLDGLSLDNSIPLEIKCIRHELHREALEGKVPLEYYPQVQHILLATGLPKLHYWSYSLSSRFPPMERVALVIVRRNEDYICELFKKEEEFFQKILDAQK